ncbi:MAG: 16S rRNA (uracil(1498)-N(3))-methyltransferase [Bacteroides sp.]|nr:16S rRNA (uracil(1498)-N(3))-methyltransferase [Prevotella sp.]MCM1408445.1 16S rRNA (uracil(1498)-N(3))-methyltransferase [Treponema brennaborense]MCM1469393.1 16S rRNA (uracil(1498)-N(3))-methyltransferase [Bacteroides sp.]
MRQFIAASEPDGRGRLAVSGHDSHYLSRVLRLKPGAVIEVRLPSGALVPMTVSSIAADAVILETAATCADAGIKSKLAETGVSAGELEHARLVSGRSAPAEMWLFQFLPRVQKMDIIVRSAAECGIAVIVPIDAGGAFSGSAGNKMERWNRIIREARQQSGSAVPTRIEFPVDLQTAVRLWKTHCTEISEKPKTASASGISGSGRAAAFVLHESPEKSADSVFAHFSRGAVPEIVALAVGAEGGIGPAELDMLVMSGFSVVHFNTNIMRTETAALYGIAVIQNALTEIDSWRVKE